MGSDRYTLYSSNNPPNYPVSSVNGQTGAVVLSIPPAFVDNPAAAELTVAEDILDSSVWALIRETDNGYVGIAVDSTSGSQAAYLQIGTGAGKQLIKLLTLADIPQSSGVVSINGLSGVVILSGADIEVSTLDTRKINVVLAGLETDVSALQDMDDYIREALVFDEQGQTTAIHNIPAGSFVYWNNGMNTASQAISIGDTLSSTNLTAVPAGGVINVLNSKIIDIHYNNFGTAVSLLNYTSSDNMYEFPADGYLYLLTNNAGQKLAGILRSNDPLNTFGISIESENGKQNMSIMFVRKGMKFYLTEITSNPNPRFIPLT